MMELNAAQSDAAVDVRWGVRCDGCMHEGSHSFRRR